MKREDVIILVIHAVAHFIDFVSQNKGNASLSFSIMKTRLGEVVKSDLKMLSLLV